MRCASLLLALALVLGTRAAAAAPGQDPVRPDRRLTGSTSPTPEQVFAYDALCVRADAAQGWHPCRGVEGDALSYQDFYRLTGRKDLVDADHSRWFRRELLTTIGSLAAGAGVALVLPRLLGKSVAPLWVSAGLFAGGAGLYIWGAQISQDPLIGRPEAEDLARSFNQSFRERLGLPPLDGRRLAIGLGLRRAF